MGAWSACCARTGSRYRSSSPNGGILAIEVLLLCDGRGGAEVLQRGQSAHRRAIKLQRKIEAYAKCRTGHDESVYSASSVMLSRTTDASSRCAIQSVWDYNVDRLHFVAKDEVE